MIWISVDPSNNFGITQWDDDKFMHTYKARKMGGKGKWVIESNTALIKQKVYDSKWHFVKQMLSNVDFIAMEEGFGRFASAVKSQAGYRQYVQAVADYHAHELQHAIKIQIVNVSEWRRCIKEEFGISWPATTARKKELSIELVRKAYGITVTDDEADSVLLGRACIRMWMITTKGQTP